MNMCSFSSGVLGVLFQVVCELSLKGANSLGYVDSLLLTHVP